MWHIRTCDGIGEIEGPQSSITSSARDRVDWSEDEFEQAAERVCTLERALQVRHWGRDRSMDERVLPYFEQPECAESLPGKALRPGSRAVCAGRGCVLHAARLGYAERLAHPRDLSELGLGDVYEPMVDGAAKAKERHPTPDYR